MQEAFIGSLHPAASLFETSFRLPDAIAQHRQFCDVVRRHGVQLYTVREVLLHGCFHDLVQRNLLERLAMFSLVYDASSVGDRAILSDEERFLLSDAYKLETLQTMSPNHLADIVLCRPTVHLGKSDRNTPLVVNSVSFQPMSNLVFTRDQQITTAAGIVLGQLGPRQRHHEMAVMKVCFKKLHINVLGAVKPPGQLEGGDFFPLGPDLCLLGVGLRTNLTAAEQLIANGWFGTRRVALVVDIFDRSQDRMHLDTIFNICSDTLCVMLDKAMGGASPIRRLVDEYVLDPEARRYTRRLMHVEFSEYIRAQGFEIIPVTNAEQLAYGCNHVNLGNSRLIGVNVDVARKIAQHPRFDGSMEVVNFSGITAMYGATHCAIQVIKRTRRASYDQIAAGKSPRPCPAPVGGGDAAVDALVRAAPRGRPDAPRRSSSVRAEPLRGGAAMARPPGPCKPTTAEHERRAGRCTDRSHAEQRGHGGQRVHGGAEAE